MTEYEKLLKLEEAYPDYGEYQYTVRRRFCGETGDALSDHLRNGATVCKEDAALTDTVWNRTYTVEEFNAGFKVTGIEHGEEKMVALWRLGANWRDAAGTRYSYRDDGLFEKSITYETFEMVKRITDDFILVS